MATVLRSFAKINLGLRIGPVRADGFHGLCTLYQTIGLHDLVMVSARRSDVTRISLSSSDERVPTDARNTAWRMVEAALLQMRITAEVEIHIQKNLPVQGGLGAGSANAAAALIGLERELGASLSGPERLQLAGEIGSDVPLFLVGGASVGMSRGEVVVPYPDLPPTHCVIAAPAVGVSTPTAFREWDRLQSQPISEDSERGHPDISLTPARAFDRLEKLSRVYASAVLPVDEGLGASGVPGQVFSQEKRSLVGDLAGNPLPALVRTGIANDFEEVVLQQHPPLRDILHALHGQDGLSEEQRAIVAMLSGSGSSLFGLYRTEEDAVAAQQRVLGMGTAASVTSTLPRSLYWQTMLVK